MYKYIDHNGDRMQEVNISEFKAKCLALIEEVNKTKKPLRVTRHGKPVAEVVPPSPAAKEKKFVGSGMKMFDILDDDIVGPIIDFDEMEIFRD
jgi:prevent-host-death family protein